MTDTQDHSQETLIKTPRQLVLVVVLAFIVPVTVIVMLVSYVTGGVRVDPASSAFTPEAVAARIAPVAGVDLAEAEAPRGSRSGEQIVKSVCQACHGTGVANAPKLGDKTAWAKLIAEGQKRLVADSMKGVRGMPARGGDASLSDVEFERAVVYMVNQAGGSFKEPPAPKPDAK
ncbi:MAG: cytochrome c5 family protein [Burkholderiales bacterium]|nr:cytochrome c5 family protein [Burkholderiales bacterium]